MKKLHVILSTMAFCLCALHLQAATYSWIGAVDGDWTNAGNWDANGVPVDTDLGTTALEMDYSPGVGDRIVFNAGGSANPVPTSNLPSLGGNPFSWQTRSTPAIDMLFGNLNFSLPGFQGGVVVRNAWTTNIGDGNTGNGAASLTYTSSFANGLVRDTHDSPPAGTWNVYADGTFILDDSTTAVTFSYGTDRYSAINIAGGKVTVLAQLDMLRGSSALGPSYFDFTALGGSLTAEFGTDFPDLTSVQAATGAGMTFRSTADLVIASADNGNGTFTVSTIPEPGTMGLLGVAGMAMVLLRRIKQ